MAGTLLDAKVRVPRLRRGLVARPRLSDRMSRGSDSVLTLVSAPAGFGKTTLLTDWVAGLGRDGRAIAWLSLDQRDNDPTVFWTYVVAALRTAVDGIGAGALALLQSPQPPVEAVLSALLNDLHAAPTDVVLVLDDYHHIDTRDIHDGMAFLLEHLPEQVHVVIAGRTDPLLPLGRLRGQGELVEIRVADLRFTPDEAAAYLSETMGLSLTAQEILMLERRTEGWIAALQLAALSMQGREDVAGFVAGFGGDDRYVVDYLAEEVLQRQPESTRLFLLMTSILDRLSGPLCDAVTSQSGGTAQLAALERANLFLVPLDDRRQWYRYHQLFADVLQAHLLDERSGDVPELHRRASLWYQQNDDAAEAIRHAFAAGDLERAAGLIELAIPAMRRTRQEAALRVWQKMLPDDLVHQRPVLTVGLAGALLSGGQLDGVDNRLRIAERWIHRSAVATPSEDPAIEMVVVDRAEFSRLPATIEMYRAALALAEGNTAATVRHAQQAISLAQDEDDLCRAGSAGLMGLAFWGSGDLEAGHRAYSDCVAGLLKAGFVADTLGCAIALADIRVTQGRLRDALRTYEQALSRAAEEGKPVLRGTADMYVGLSELHRERGDLRAARKQLQHAQELGENTGLPQNPYRRRVAMARICEADGDLEGAVTLLNAAERVYVGDFFPAVRPIPALRARVWIRQGNLGEALDWAHHATLSTEDELSYGREFEHLTLARLLLARSTAEHDQGLINDAVRLLERLLTAAEEGLRTGSVIEILVVQALAHQARGDTASALALLRRALTLAEPEHYVRVFADEGAPMTTLLRTAAKRGIAPSYVRRLLSGVATNRPAERGLVEELSARELDILRMLNTDLDGPDIARELVVSLNTVRTHTKHVYAKLGVNNRRAAVRRARELGLLA
ncbi:LuxR C-terminal-related transcriptional regulator [Kribbella sp. VKM Ac-2566]|uniref:LuxR C-terminal-related transcriptional regulator n=1 Tax=Kribbella sp. VKM Ac-2566 TaxID=2512218 RepID=UPI001062F038|nr:LuxR C-terminal-related transcriptional regulator [Kribbella sp. VKM Ac-2566]TDW92210.1 LuxR family maltose regulon positive regulatory protein [Kribbella sp. VKM Ac-2566]